MLRDALVPLLVFVAFSLRSAPNINWTGPLWLAIIPLMARRLTPVPGAGESWKEAWGQKLWTPTLVIVLLSYGALFHYLAIGLPGVPYRQDKVQPVAWRLMGEDVEKIESEIAARTGERPLVVGMDKYNLASELAFYARGEGESVEEAVANTASRNLFGGGALMYEIWSPAEKFSGRTLLLISFTRQALSDGALAGYAQNLGPIEERSIVKFGVPAGRYYYRVVDGYRSDAAAPTAHPS